MCLNKCVPLQLRGSGPPESLRFACYVMSHTKSTPARSPNSIKRAPPSPSLPGHNQQLNLKFSSSCSLSNKSRP